MIHFVAAGDFVAKDVTSTVVACELQMRHTSAVVMHGLVMQIPSKASIIESVGVSKDCATVVNMFNEAGCRRWLSM